MFSVISTLCDTIFHTLAKWISEVLLTVKSFIDHCKKLQKVVPHFFWGWIETDTHWEQKALVDPVVLAVEHFFGQDKNRGCLKDFDENVGPY